MAIEKINLINELIRHINLLLLTEQDQTHEINVIMSGSKILLQVFFHWGCWQLLKLEMWGSFLAFVTSCRDFRVHPRCCLVSVYNIIYTKIIIYIYHVTWRIHHKKRYKMRIYIHMYPSHIYIFFFQDTPCIYYEKKIIYIYICVLILPFKHKWEDPACSAFFQSSGEPARQVAGPRRQCRQAAVCWATRGFNGKGRRFSGLNMFKKYEKMHESCEIPRFFRAVSKSFEEREVRNLERLGIWKTNKQKHKQTKKQTNKQTKPNQTKPNQTKPTNKNNKIKSLTRSCPHKLHRPTPGPKSSPTLASPATLQVGIGSKRRRVSLALAAACHGHGPLLVGWKVRPSDFLL